MMTEEMALEMSNVLNNEYMPIVDKFFKNKLGVKVASLCTFSRGRSEYYFTVRDIYGKDVNNKMRGNKILRSIFKNAYIQTDVWDASDTFGFRTIIYYDHNDGGSNGKELMTFYINKDTKKITVRKY